MSGHSSQQFSLQPLLASSLASLSPLPCLVLALAVLFSRSHLMLHQGSRETIPVGSVTVVEPARSDAASLQGWRLLPQRFRLWNLQVLLLPTHLSQRRTQFQYSWSRLYCLLRWELASKISFHFRKRLSSLLLT